MSVYIARSTLYLIIGNAHSMGYFNDFRENIKFAKGRKGV